VIQLLNDKSKKVIAIAMVMVVVLSAWVSYITYEISVDVQAAYIVESRIKAYKLIHQSDKDLDALLEKVSPEERTELLRGIHDAVDHAMSEHLKGDEDP